MADPIRYLTKSPCRLQFGDLPGARRQVMKRALRRYCELDTLAMGMAVQDWMDVARA